jgi:hypothetical protein
LAQISKNLNSFDEIKKEVLDLGFIRFMVEDEIYSI